MPPLSPPFSTPASMPPLSPPFSTPGGLAEEEETPRSAVKELTPSAACAAATASALADLTTAVAAPGTPSPPKASPRSAAPVEGSAVVQDDARCLLDQASAPPPPPVAYPTLAALNDVISKSYVIAGAAVGLAAGLAYSLKLTTRRP